MKLIPYNKILRDHFKINIFSFFYMQVHPITDHIPYSLTYILSSHPHKDQLHVTVTPGWSRIVKPFDLYIYVYQPISTTREEKQFLHAYLSEEKRQKFYSFQTFSASKKNVLPTFLGREKRKRERERRGRKKVL